MISYREFKRVDIRVGEVVSVEPFPEGKSSTHVLKIYFGKDIGEKVSLARLLPSYEAEDLVGKQVLCVVNLKPKQIGKYISEVLTLGVPDESENVVFIHPGWKVPLGGKLY